MRVRSTLPSKALLAEPGDRLEVPVGRFVIDLVRADGELVEVQSRRLRRAGPEARRAARRAPRPDRAPDRGRAPDRPRRRARRGGRRPALTQARDGGGRVRQAGRLPVAAEPPEPDDRGAAAARGSHPPPAARRSCAGAPATRASGGWSTSSSAIVLRTPQDIVAVLPALPSEPFSTRELADRLGCGTVLAQRTRLLPAVDRDRRPCREARERAAVRAQRLASSAA